MLWLEPQTGTTCHSRFLLKITQKIPTARTYLLRVSSTINSRCEIVTPFQVALCNNLLSNSNSSVTAKLSVGRWQVHRPVDIFRCPLLQEEQFLRGLAPLSFLEAISKENHRDMNTKRSKSAWKRCKIQGPTLRLIKPWRLKTVLHSHWTAGTKILNQRVPLQNAHSTPKRTVQNTWKPINFHSQRISVTAVDRREISRQVKTSPTIHEK